MCAIASRCSGWSAVRSCCHIINPKGLNVPGLHRNYSFSLPAQMVALRHTSKKSLVRTVNKRTVEHSSIYSKEKRSMFYATRNRKGGPYCCPIFHSVIGLKPSFTTYCWNTRTPIPIMKYALICGEEREIPPAWWTMGKQSYLAHTPIYPLASRCTFWATYDIWPWAETDKIWRWAHHCYKPRWIMGSQWVFLPS